MRTILDSMPSLVLEVANLRTVEAVGGKMLPYFAKNYIFSGGYRSQRRISEQYRNASLNIGLYKFLGNNDQKRSKKYRECLTCRAIGEHENDLIGSPKQRICLLANPFWAGAMVLLIGVFWADRKNVGRKAYMPYC